MKLARRINLILLPIILGVFLLAGFFAYQVFYRLGEQALLNKLSGEIHLLNREVEHVAHFTQSSAANILNSSELISFLNTRDPEYRAYGFEVLLYRLLDQVQQYEKHLEVLQVLTSTESVLITTGMDDPFLDQPAVLVPATALKYYREQKQGMDRSKFQNIDLIFQAEDGSYRYLFFAPFSPMHLVGNETVPIVDPHYLFVAVSGLAVLDRFIADTRDSYGNRISVKLSPKLNMGNHDANVNVETMASGDLAIRQANNLFDLEVLIPKSVVRQKLSGLRHQLILLAIFLSFLCFGVLRWLIQRQILTPIAMLIKQIHQSREDDNYIVQPLNRNDELSELNNAYGELISHIQHIASHDSLTGLANRYNFHCLLERQLNSLHSDRGKTALLFIDLDNFKRINDLFGHEAGDRLLQVFGNKLVELTRPTDFVALLGKLIPARLAGDEFALLLNDIPSAEAAATVAQRIIDLFHGGLEVDGKTYSIQVSIGIALAPDDGETKDILLKHADAAMYQAKADGKNRYYFFTRSIAAEIEQKQKIDRLLNKAVCDKNFELVFMPIFDIEHSRVQGAEVLIRSPLLSAEGIGPDKFIPVAESSGLIKEIDSWVVEQAFSRLTELCAQYPFQGTLAINISAVELHNDNFPELIKSLLKKYHIDPALIELEITETSLVPNDDHSIKTLTAIRETGVSLSLDDFGTGFTAFSQLANYPVDCLKIDRSFVNNAAGTARNKQSMVEIILALAQLYGLRVVAEGVETADQLEYLKKRGCKYAQGYLLSKPKSWDEVVPMLTGAKSVAIVP